MKIYAIIGGLVVIAGIAWFLVHTGEKLCEGEHAAVAISDAGTHVTRDDLKDFMERTSDILDRIFEKLDDKADK